MDNNNILSKAPFLRILPVIVTGILAANAVAVPLWIAAALFIGAAAVSAVWIRREWSSWTVALSVFFFAVCMTYVTATRQVMPHGEKVIATLHITDNPLESGRWRRATARIDRFRRTAGEDGWSRSGEKVVIRFDTAHHITAGDRMVAETYIRPVADSTYSGYGRLMYRRGYSASAWVYRDNTVTMLPGKARTPMYYAAKMQAAASERMDRLRIGADETAVAKAMAIGSRDSISPEVRESYSLTGASHILAVSGLHVGIVALLVNALLWLLPLARRGHLAKNLVSVAAIWAYAMLAGLSPSVVRAAIMFSGLQFALFTSRRGGGLNGLLGTAAVMLLINPDYLYDVSFQLSFAAVAGIMVLYPPVYSLVVTKRKWLNAVWSIVLIGVAATVATAPLTAYYFGRIPVIGIFINPLVIITAHIIVLFSLLWIILPIAPLNGIFSWVIGSASELQNSVTAFSSTQKWAAVPIQFSAAQTIFIYLAGGIALWLAWKQIPAITKRRPARQ